MRLARTALTHTAHAADARGAVQRQVLPDITRRWPLEWRPAACVLRPSRERRCRVVARALCHRRRVSPKGECLSAAAPPAAARASRDLAATSRCARCALLRWCEASLALTPVSSASGGDAAARGFFSCRRHGGQRARCARSAARHVSGMRIPLVHLARTACRRTCAAGR
jgi:hypothetical protein